MNRALVLAACLAALPACGDEADQATDTGLGNGGAEPQLSACEQAFSDAAAIPDLADSQDDVEPTFFACDTISEWVDASEQFQISGGLAGRTYAETQCRFNRDVKQSPVCLDIRGS